MSEAELYPEPLPQGDYTLVAESEAGTSAAFLNVHHPDVLLCLANLSNDEVFTPPNVVNAMLDLLPESLWHDPTATFLDPCCKSGVFLREIAKRLIAGLAESIPDLQTRLDHIFTRQLFGLGITDLTALLSRRSVYCSKTANGRYSLTRFPSAEGNIRLPHSCHTWKDGRCVQCGASQAKYDRPGREAHAYAFIHGINPEELFRMKFDVIIGNPPYQLDDGGNGASASPIYHKFVQAAKKLNPSYISFIIPARWYTGGKGLEEFRSSMLSDSRISILVDYHDSRECFPDVDIAGGVCYFLWERSKIASSCKVVNVLGDKTNTDMRSLNEVKPFVRFNQALSIIRKIKRQSATYCDALVSSRKPFGLDTTIQPLPKGDNTVRLRYRGGTGNFSLAEVRAHREWVPKWKVIVSRLTAEHAGQVDKDGRRGILSSLGILPPHHVCTETYLVAGVFDTENEALSFQTYLKSRIVRFLIAQIAVTQQLSKVCFSLVPQQDFSEVWTDEKLYRKYGLTAEEIAFIERMIKPMEV